MAGRQTSGPTRVLVVANRTAARQRLLDAGERRPAAAPCRFTLLVPDVEDRRDADWTLESARRLLAKAAGRPVGGLAGGPAPAAAGQGGRAAGRRAGGRPGPVRGRSGGGGDRSVRRDHHLDAPATDVEVAAPRSGGARPRARAAGD